jgi:diguanylate cyclase (GGDEF)-like protein
VQDKPFGTYINDGNFDGTERLVSYRKVDKLPLVVIVAVSTEHVLAGHAEVRRKYITAALGITAITLLVMLLSVIHRRRLDMAHDGLRRSEALARTKSSELQTTLENIDQGILMADAQGNLLVLNLRAVELLDLPREWLHARPNLKTLLRYLADRGEYGKNGELIDRPSWDNILNGGLDIPVGQHERTRPDGTVLEINARRLPDGGMVRTLTDVTERKRTEAEVARLATHDELTGLANRGLFRERVNAALNRAQRYGDSFALMLFDLDRFKEINDSHGHPAGDAVLKEVGRRLALCVRERGVAARLGGDEFAILQTRARTDEEAAEFARHIIAAIRAPFVLDGENIPLATSIGITLVPRDGADYEQLVKKADQALYRAKERGGNIFCFSRTGTALRAPPDGTARAVA